MPRAGSHESSVHGLLSVSTGAGRAKHEPAKQASAPLHGFPSEHDVPLGSRSCRMPPEGLQESTVHGLLSLSAGGMPGWHCAFASHVSSPLHAFPSLHDVPGVWVMPCTESHESTVHGLSSTIGGGFPASQAPALQT